VKLYGKFAEFTSWTQFCEYRDPLVRMPESIRSIYGAMWDEAKSDYLQAGGDLAVFNNMSCQQLQDVLVGSHLPPVKRRVTTGPNPQRSLLPILAMKGLATGVAMTNTQYIPLPELYALKGMNLRWVSLPYMNNGVRAPTCEEIFGEQLTNGQILRCTVDK